MTTRLSAGFILLIIVTGCEGSQKLVSARDDVNHHTMEIARNPSILHLHRDQWATMSLNGIRLGDDPNRVLPESRIRTRRKDGWIYAKDNCRYRVIDGRVGVLGVWDARLLAQLEINSREDIEAKFGRPDRIDDVGKEQIYRYQDGHIRVVWNSFEKRLNTVNVVE